MRAATEDSLRRYIAPTLRALHGFSVETATLPGVPDINHVGGWLELKIFKPWPKDVDENVRTTQEFTPQQREFARERYRVGGRVHLLAQARSEPLWMLFAGPWAAEHLGRVSRSELERWALAMWKNKLDQAHLLKLLKGETK